MMNQIVNMVIRQVTRQLVRKGVGVAMKSGGDALKKGGAAMAKRRQKDAAAEPEPQAPAATVEPFRKRHADERKGDEVLYPTDDFTEDMQPRR